MPIKLANIPAAPEGMNQQVKPWEIPDGQCRMLVDGMLDKEAQINRRGPIKPGTTPAVLPTTATEQAIGIVACDDPDYNWKVAVLHGTSGTSKISFLNSTYTTLNERRYSPDTEGLFFNPANRYRLATSAHPRGGTFIGTNKFNGQSSIGHWGGGTLDDYSTGTVTVVQDSTSVSGSSTSWDNNTDIEAGMFLYAVCDHATSSGKNYIGQIKTVNSTTSLTLVDGALHDVTARSYKITSVRALDRRVAKGTITCVEGASNKIVDGANTKFKRQNLHTGGPWEIFRADDMKYVGKVASVASDTQLTLNAAAAISCDKDEFVAIDMTGDRAKLIQDSGDFGWITASYAGRTWYANRPYSNKPQPKSPSRVWFSDLFEPEAIDRTADGDHILIPSSKPPLKAILAMYGMPDCLVIWKENETYAIYGTDESNFSLKKIDVDDGCMSPQTVQPFQEGVIFAGSKGIWFFDGQDCFNILEDKMDNWYERAMENASYRSYPPTSMYYKGQYFLHVPKADPPSGPDRSDNQTNAEEGTPYTHVSMAIELQRRAVSLLTNFALVGAVRSPEEENLGTIFLVNKLADSTPYALQGFRLCFARDLLDTDGLDTITTQLVTPYSTQLGPDFFFESKRYDLGDPQLKKRFKQLQMNYRLDSITGNFITYGTADTVESLSHGSSTTGEAIGDTTRASSFTIPRAGECSELAVWMDGLGSGTGNQDIRGFIYTDVAGSPGTLVAASDPVTVLDGQAAGYVRFAFDVDLAAADYWVGVHASNTNSQSARWYRTAGQNNYVSGSDTYADGTAASFGVATPSNFELDCTLTLAYGLYDLHNNNLNFATMVGLNELSTTSNGTWTVTRALNSQNPRVWKAGFQNKRMKFNKRSTHLGFKMWQANRTGIKTLRIGPMALGFKEMRPGRV